MEKNGKISWRDYVGSHGDHKVDPAMFNIGGIDEILNFNPHFHHFFSASVPVIYLLDYTTGKYLMMTKTSKDLFGYNSDYLKDAGVYFAFEIYQKDFLRVYSEQTFSERLSFIKNISPAEQSKYIFSHNFKLRTKKGDYKNFLQRACFVQSDSKGNPLLSLGMIININNYGSENTLTSLVEKMDDSSELTHTQPIEKKMYFLHDEDKLLSKREKEILLWIAEGLTSRQIAEKLFISEYTVHNHRRNMMEKTNCRNVSELVKFAIHNKLI